MPPLHQQGEQGHQAETKISNLLIFVEQSKVYIFQAKQSLYFSRKSKLIFFKQSKVDIFQGNQSLYFSRKAKLILQAKKSQPGVDDSDAKPKTKMGQDQVKHAGDNGYG